MTGSVTIGASATYITACLPYFSSPAAPTDSNSVCTGKWHLVAQATQPGYLAQSLYACIAPTTGGTTTFTNPSTAPIQVGVWSGLYATGVPDQSAFALASSVGPITPTKNNEAVVTCAYSSTASTLSAPSSPLAAINSPVVGSGNASVADGYVIQTTATAVTATFTTTPLYNILIASLFSTANPPTLRFITSAIPTGFSGVAYSYTLPLQFGTPPYTCSITSGTLPSGLSLTNDASGNVNCKIVGTHTGGIGPVSLTFHAVDSSGTPQTADTSGATLTILSPPQPPLYAQPAGLSPSSPLPDVGSCEWQGSQSCPNLHGYLLFPGSAWNTNISGYSVDPQNTLLSSQTFWSGGALRNDFFPGYGYPWQVVDSGSGNTQLYPILVGLTTAVTASSGSTTLTIASATDAAQTVNGALVTGYGITYGTRVSSGGGTQSIVLSLPTTAALPAGSLVNFSLPGGTSFDSDIMFAPVPLNSPIESGGGSPGKGCPSTYVVDGHVLTLDRHTNTVYETFATHLCNGGTVLTALQETEFNAAGTVELKRPWGRTSSDASGSSMLAGLLKYGEIAACVAAGSPYTTVPQHAVRVVMARTSNYYDGPQTGVASHPSFGSGGLMELGMRIRLKSGYDVTGFSPTNQCILNEIKQYGMIVADEGTYDWAISGDSDKGWTSDVNNLTTVPSSQFELVNSTPALPGYVDCTNCGNNPFSPFPVATATGSSSGTTALTVSGVTGTISVGDEVQASGVANGVYVASGSGTSWVTTAATTISGAVTFALPPVCYPNFDPGNLCQTPLAGNNPPTINSFSANHSTVTPGSPVVLTYSTTGDTYSYINNAGAGAPGGDSITIYPTATNTYQLNSVNLYGNTFSVPITVTVSSSSGGVSMSGNIKMSGSVVAQ